MKTIEEAVKTILASEDLKAELTKCDSEEKITGLFAKLGCKAEYNEITEYLKENGTTKKELSDEEIKDVAGGTSIFVVPVEEEVRSEGQS